eukprot:CAMPEP_0184392498 /NCGR_PEP_ID=MMETSP0007-20130409/27476_1 /TAXON_ID=97485 /ORGANISM="Prymnesium parvum, Strain Texoma1" /LENGTH=134 /DNA_ID=CAMNT_0026743079 /DNA_START=275 /DNA_END=676 /DNA_ORIENTATION=+
MKAVRVFQENALDFLAPLRHHLLDVHRVSEPAEVVGDQVLVLAGLATNDHNALLVRLLADQTRRRPLLLRALLHARRVRAREAEDHLRPRRPHARDLRLQLGARVRLLDPLSDAREDRAERLVHRGERPPRARG